jgi:Flp pilus assembly protein TadD
MNQQNRILLRQQGTTGMSRRRVKSLGYGLFAIAMVIVPLAGCSSMGGASAFGSNRLEVAEISNIGSYSAETALAEGRAHFRNSDFGHSAALYKRVVELSPKNPEGYIGLGASYDRLRRFDLADRVYSSLRDLTGPTAQYYNNVGYSNLLRGNLAAAFKNFREAQKLAPDSIVIANNLQLLKDATARS